MPRRLDGLGNPVLERDARTPTEPPSDFLDVEHEIPGLRRAVWTGPGGERHATPTGGAHHRGGSVDEACGDAAADVECLADRTLVRGGPEKHVHHVADMNVVTYLMAGRKDLNVRILERQPDEVVQDVVSGARTGGRETEWIRQPQYGRPHAVERRVQAMIDLARHLVDAIDGSRTLRVILVDRQRDRRAELQARSREHDACLWLPPLHALEDGQRPAAIDAEIRQRLGVARDSPRQAAGVEHRGRPLDGEPHVVDATDVTLDDSNPWRQSVDDGTQAPAGEHCDDRAETAEPGAQVKPEKAQTHNRDWPAAVLRPLCHDEALGAHDAWSRAAISKDGASSR